MIIMSEQKNRKQFLVQERKDILAQVDVSKETRVALGARLGIVPSTLNTILKNRKDTKIVMKNAVGCVGRNSHQQKELRVF
jgi:hypothetical protein